MIVDAPEDAPAMHEGSCLCGAVSFRVEGELERPVACHCSQCRRQSGHYWASTDVERSALTLRGEEHLSWFHASEKVRRGFCKTCGSWLFWDPLGKPKIAVAMGAFDQPTQTTLHMHIFVGDKGDYYELGDGLPQKER